MYPEFYVHGPRKLRDKPQVAPYIRAGDDQVGRATQQLGSEIDTIFDSRDGEAVDVVQARVCGVEADAW